MLSDQEVFSVYRQCPVTFMVSKWCLKVSMTLPFPTPFLLTHYSKA